MVGANKIHAEQKR